MIQYTWVVFEIVSTWGGNPWCILFNSLHSMDAALGFHQTALIAWACDRMSLLWLSVHVSTWGSWNMGLPDGNIYHQTFRTDVIRVTVLGMCQGGVHPAGRPSTRITKKMKFMYNLNSFSCVYYFFSVGQVLIKSTIKSTITFVAVHCHCLLWLLSFWTYSHIRPFECVLFFRLQRLVDFTLPLSPILKKRYLHL